MHFLIAPQSPIFASTAREDILPDPPMTPRLDVYELGKYAGQFLLLFRAPEAALQISLSAYNKLTQVWIVLYFITLVILLSQ